MSSFLLRAEWKNSTDKQNILDQVARINQLAQELSDAIRDLNYSPVRVVIEETPPEGKSDGACEN